MKILILSYACEPGAGSEYGVGWNVPFTLAWKYPEHEVYVATRSRCRKKIEDRLQTLGLRNLHFVFYDIPQCLYYKNEMKSRWGEQYNYILWQFFARKDVKKIVEQYQIDIVHHLTFNQYRTPSPGFYLHVPFVFGPVGGAETINPAFDRDLSAHTRKKEKIRRKGYDLRLFKSWIRKEKNQKVILFSTKENHKRLSPYCRDCGTEVYPAIGFSPSDFPSSEGLEEAQSHKTFEMIYAGKALDWKGLKIFLDAVSGAFLPVGINDFSIKLVGIRYEEEQEKIKQWVAQAGVENNVELIPFVERAQLLDLLSGASLSVYPAFRDSGSMSVLEASALGCPTICFDAGGQDAFPDEVLIKIPVSESYEANLHEFSQRLLWAYNHPEKLKEIGKNAKAYVYTHLTWEKKVEHFMEIYQRILENHI